MCIIISRVDVEWNLAFQGFLPSKYIFPNGAFYTCTFDFFVPEMIRSSLCIFIAVGILGATVMPHSLFLGSALATQDRDPSPRLRAEESNAKHSSSTIAQVVEDAPKEIEHRNALQPCKYRCLIHDLYKRFRLIVIRAFRSPYGRPYPTACTVKYHEDRENNDFDFVKRHLYHGIVDMVGSLLGFAVVINSMLRINYSLFIILTHYSL